jgi:hypothetical protein
MRMVNDLVIRGEPSEVYKFVERIEGVAPNGWKREPETEERLRSFGAAPQGAYCFSWKGSEGKPAASVLLYKRGLGELSVSNIVPAERRPLTDEEYNDLLTEFQENVLTPLSKGVEVQLIVIEPQLRLEELLSPEAWRQLQSFSEAADKRTVKPRDWERWNHFAIQTYRDNCVIDYKDLGTWLEEEGWPPGEVVQQLIGRLEVARSLLAQYDGQDFL